jgi:hypothetical protein
VGRLWRASPSEGYPTAHARAQDRIVREVLESPPRAAVADAGAGAERQP